VTLLAEDLLLLLVDDDSGKFLLDLTRLDRALAGALLLELALGERVGESEVGRRFGRDRVRPRPSRSWSRAAGRPSWSGSWRRAAALTSLLVAVDAVAKVVPTDDRRALVRRAEVVAEGEWAGAAVKKAVDAVNAALIAAFAAASAVAASTST
jgi:hypothetical protein